MMKPLQQKGIFSNDDAVGGIVQDGMEGGVKGRGRVFNWPLPLDRPHPSPTKSLTNQIACLSFQDGDRDGALEKK